MPRTYLPHQKIRWLDLFESGKTEKWIANYTKCDYRTVKKGIEEARRDRYAIAAQVELVKDALRGHKDQLLMVLDEMRLMMAMPADNLEIRTERNGGMSPISLTRARVRADSSGGLLLDVPAEETVAWELIQQHLKGDKVWRSYKEWKEAVLTHIQAKVDLKSAVARFIKDKTDLGIRDKVSQGDETGSVYPETVQLFYEVATYRSLGRIDGTNLEGRMVASPDGYVRNGVGGTSLAYAPLGADECRKELLQALESLYRSSEVERVGTSHSRLQEVIDRTRRIIDEIALLHMLPGSCRVCRRLGIK